jgi:LacI family transcriptional regulator
VATIYDIAKRAGVSPATVSKVLNGYPDVSDKTRKKIHEITEELQFQPNAAARGLTTKRSMLIGVFFRDHVNSGLRHPFFQNVLASFKDVVGNEGYDLLFFANEQNGPESFEARALQRDVDGILLVGVPRTDPAVASLAASRIPCMSIDLDLLGQRAGYLCSDNVGGAKLAVNFLISCGHRNIGFLGGSIVTKPGHDRLLGYQQACQANNLSMRREWILEGDFTETSGYLAGSQLAELRELPTAVFCASDMMALGMISALREKGIEAGRDISVVGFDDVEMAHFVTPGLTTIRQRTDLMGEQAAKALVSLIEGPDIVPPVLTVETELVVRGTVNQN